MKPATLIALIMFAGAARLSAQDDGPFGLRMGMTKGEVQKAMGAMKEGQPGRFLAPTPPKKHPGFETYVLMISPSHGLCKIVAVGVNVPLNSFGDRLKDQFKDINTALTEKYGEPKTFDYLKAGSVWKDADDWAMALVQEERTLASFWDTPNAPGGVVNVVLSAKALDSRTGYLSLAYESASTKECFAEVTKSERSVF